MSTPPNIRSPLRERLDNAPGQDPRWLREGAARVRLGDLRTHTSLGGRASALAGRSVLVATRSQLAAALALVELDGVAARLILCTPDLPPAHLRGIAERGGVDAVVSDHDGETDGLTIPLRIPIDSALASARGEACAERRDTEWVLLTSGTTGAPKMVVHSVASLTAPIGGALGQGEGVVWGTFYDIRRYGGLQIFFRALLGRGSLVLSSPGEPIAQHLARLGAEGATHVSGTPSHWRRVLMCASARAIAPGYVRLSGEIADQAVLNALHAFYPRARIGHAFASTEAGVAFEVNDGLEGFPAAIVGPHGDVQISVDEGSLRIRSTRAAARYLDDAHQPLSTDDGFTDTGDIVERRGDRYYFLGRRSGVINVGGLKVYPEEVEAAINRHPAVRMSRVRPRKSSITGALVAADVVLKGTVDPIFTREILKICRDSLPPHKIPATIRFVPALEMAAAGKLARHA